MSGQSETIARLKRELLAAELALAAQVRAESVLTQDQKDAIILHDAMCQWNHTDGCGWHYEIKGGQHDWNGHAHGGYLSKAEKMNKEMKCDHLNMVNFVELVKIANGY